MFVGDVLEKSLKILALQNLTEYVVVSSLSIPRESYMEQEVYSEENEQRENFMKRGMRFDINGSLG